MFSIINALSIFSLKYARIIPMFVSTFVALLAGIVDTTYGAVVSDFGVVSVPVDVSAGITFK